jgi:hypothetical protein
VADNYLQFSETLGPLNKKQEAWLRQQIAPIVVVNGKEYPEDSAPDSDAADYRGLRFLREYEDPDDNDAETQGFGLDFEGTGKDRHAWISAEANGDPAHVAHLVQKFLRKFWPDQCWSLTYATTCSKLRIGEFSGGAVFVTAGEIRWENAYDFIEQQRAAFKAPSSAVLHAEEKP